MTRRTASRALRRSSVNPERYCSTVVALLGMRHLTNEITTAFRSASIAGQDGIRSWNNGGEKTLLPFRIAGGFE